MYFFNKLIPLFMLFMLTACVTPKLKDPYIKTTSYNLNIEHIFMPPSDEYHPFSLLSYSKKSGYDVLCPTSILSNISEQNISSKLKESTIPDTKLAAGSTLEFGISLSKADVGGVGLDHNNIKFLSINLTKGKKITMPSMHMYIAKKNLANSECKEEISIYLDSHKDSTFYIPKSLYRYTIESSILDQNHVDITAQIPSTLKQLIFAKASAKAGSIGNMSFYGEDLYIGFNGITVTNKFSPIVPKDIFREDGNMVLDVTKIVNKIQEKK